MVLRCGSGRHLVMRTCPEATVEGPYAFLGIHPSAQRCGRLVGTGRRPGPLWASVIVQSVWVEFDRVIASLSVSELTTNLYRVRRLDKTYPVLMKDNQLIDRPRAAIHVVGGLIGCHQDQPPGRSVPPTYISLALLAAYLRRSRCCGFPSSIRFKDSGTAMARFVVIRCRTLKVPHRPRLG